MVVYNFQPRFAPLVERGEKTQTIRLLGGREWSEYPDAVATDG